MSKDAFNRKKNLLSILFVFWSTLKCCWSNFGLIEATSYGYLYIIYSAYSTKPSKLLPASGLPKERVNN